MDNSEKPKQDDVAEAHMVEYSMSEYLRDFEHAVHRFQSEESSELVESRTKAKSGKIKLSNQQRTNGETTNDASAAKATATGAVDRNPLQEITRPISLEYSLLKAKLRKRAKKFIQNGRGKTRTQESVSNAMASQEYPRSGVATVSASNRNNISIRRRNLRSTLRDDKILEDDRFIDDDRDQTNDDDDDDTKANGSRGGSSSCEQRDLPPDNGDYEKNNENNDLIHILQLGEGSREQHPRQMRLIMKKTRMHLCEAANNKRINNSKSSSRGESSTATTTSILKCPTVGYEMQLLSGNPMSPTARKCQSQIKWSTSVSSNERVYEGGRHAIRKLSGEEKADLYNSRPDLDLKASNRHHAHKTLYVMCGVPYSFDRPAGVCSSSPSSTAARNRLRRNRARINRMRITQSRIQTQGCIQSVSPATKINFMMGVAGWIGNTFRCSNE